MKKSHKLKLGRILKILFVVLLLIAVFISLYISFFTLNRITDSEIAREKALLERSVLLWDRNIRYELSFMYDYIESNENVVKIRMAESETELFYSLQQIQLDLKKFAIQHHGMEEIFFLTRASEKNGFVSSYSSSNGSSSMTIKDKDLAFVSLCEADDSAGRWMVRELDGVHYLVFILQRNGNYLGCWSSVDYLLQDFSNGENDSQSSHIVFITDTDGISRTDSYLNGVQIDLDAEQDRNQETGTEYRQITQRSEFVPICFVEHIDQKAIASAVYYVRSTMIIISIALVAAIAVWSGLLDYMLYRPIRNLVRHMTQLSAGDLDTRISEKSRLHETSLLYDTFNNMAQEIQNLKISVYEHELLIQKTDIEYMKMQIHPHFLVNGINSVSAMIDMNRYDAAKEMCAYLAEYYRYQFQHTDGLISLQDEMKQVDLYMSIQKMRRPGKIDYHYEVDDACTSVQIPPISILTFAGNSIKYGMNQTNFRTDITILAKKVPEGTCITIRDKGPGFTDDILQHLDQWKPIYQKGRECIGIRNAMIRLSLFYDGNASFRAFNDEGAVVEIVIPDQA